MNMTTAEIFALVADAVQVGYMEAIKAYEPSSDIVRQSEVSKYLKLCLYDKRKFKSLVDGGYIKPVRMGKAKNSPLGYSKKEIKQAFLSQKIGAMTTTNNLRQNEL
ncbi:MAG: hypothetical protein LIR46_10165 [Bacteroidota bacterium]|nr:hypothetical protein [Bacteroidota bacterium]